MSSHLATADFAPDALPAALVNLPPIRVWVMSPKPIAHDWALAALALIWSGPIVAWIFFFDFPIELTLGAIASGLAVLVPLTWIVPPVRRLVYYTDAPERRGPNQVAAVALGFAFVGLVIFFIIPRPWFD